MPRKKKSATTETPPTRRRGNPLCRKCGRRMVAMKTQVIDGRRATVFRCDRLLRRHPKEVRCAGRAVIFDE